MCQRKNRKHDIEIKKKIVPKKRIEKKVKSEETNKIKHKTKRIDEI